MSPLQSPSLPISPPCFASARYQTPHETLVVDSSVENRKLLSPQSRRGVGGRFPSVETQEEANDVVGFSLGNNGEFPKKDDNGGCEENGVLPSLVKEVLSMPKKESFDFDDQNGDLGISRGGDGGGVVMSKEQGPIESGEISSAWKTFKKMNEVGFEADKRAMNTLLRGLCKQSITNDEVLKDAKELFKKIQEVSYGPSPYTYCLMIQALAKGGEIDEAVAHLHEMIKEGYSPRIMTYNVVLRVLCDEGRAYEALDLLLDMITRDVIPSRFSFSIVLNEFCRQGKMLDAYSVYAAAIKRGVIPYWKRKDERKDNKEYDQTLDKEVEEIAS
uniref:Pentatricopeptide repeat-containing protein n=1 Tax=Ananas comosus var. bracteatus TaxID=296719 RepID=A0A6V7PQF5_ANACO|nr:unnamed protein product [Ananas comosus var. bracteatus]